MVRYLSALNSFGDSGFFGASCAWSATTSSAAAAAGMNLFESIGEVYRSRRPRSDVRGPRSEVRGPTSEVRRPRSDVGGPRSDETLVVSAFRRNTLRAT